jgi:hypothetical protein
LSQPSGCVVEFWLGAELAVELVLGVIGSSAGARRCL